MAHLAGRNQRVLDRDPGPHAVSSGLHHGNRGRHHRLGPRNSNRDVSRRTVQALWKRHGRLALLLGVGATGVTAPAAAHDILLRRWRIRGDGISSSGNGTAASPTTGCGCRRDPR